MIAFTSGKHYHIRTYLNFKNFTYGGLPGVTITVFTLAWWNNIMSGFVAFKMSYFVASRGFDNNIPFNVPNDCPYQDLCTM